MVRVNPHVGRLRGFLVALLLAACTPPWTPASVIDSLRVFGMQAEPPEVKPGETAKLSALILDPSRPGQKNTMLWLGCEPDPYGLGRGICANLDTFGDTTSFANMSTLPDGVRFIGIDDNAGYASKADLFGPLAADDPRRQAGTVGTIVSIAVAADVPFSASTEELNAVLAKIQSKEIASQLTLFRVRVSESAAPNQNPFVDSLSVDGETLPTGATVLLRERGDHKLDVTAHDFEAYVENLPNGPENRTEKIIVSWYTSAGRFDRDRVSVESDVKAVLTAPGDTLNNNDPVPENRRGTLWAVARDTRGGQSWTSWPWYECDAGAPVPRVTSREVNGSAMTLRGSDLDQLIDVISTSTNAAVRGGYSAATKTWQGDAAAGPLVLRTKGCLRLDVAE